MISIYIENLRNRSSVFQEIRFANYLIANIGTFDSFFKKVFPSTGMNEYKEKFMQTFTDNFLIAIPKPILLSSKITLNRKDVKILRRVDKLLRRPDILEKYFYTYQTLDANLTDLDKRFSELFKFDKNPVENFVASSNTLPQDTLVILNTSSNTRLQQYQEIVYGLNSKKYVYSENLRFNNFLQKSFHKLYDRNEYLKRFVIQYSLGTTAVSVKAFSKK